MRLFLVFLFFPAIAEAQSFLPGKDSAFVRMIDGFPAKEPFDTAQYWKKARDLYVYIISDKDLYDLFGYELATRFRDFDFGNYHILGMRECRYCQRCPQEDGRSECHRNACSYGWVWRVRDNQKAFGEIPSSTFPGHIDAVIPNGRDSFFGDTIIARRSDSTLDAWYTHAGGDCHARFRYIVQKDRYYPVLLLRELNYYGGCRAGRFREFTISFARPQGILHYIKRTILKERYEQGE